ncbi:MAG TPA: uracil-DNA glycosylase [Rickettsiales bacterium]|nr:uracil-DNA glycosylase [Rickettsiales bacterium]
MSFIPPDYHCPLCPRLAQFLAQNREQYPGFYNGPVPSFGDMNAELLIVGLAPGLNGANRTGRPFTGDYAGLVLYSALRKHGFAEGNYNPEQVQDGSGDGFRLINCRITNSVRCVPPQNKPETSEIRQCNMFLKAEVAAMPALKVLVSLGQISHKAVIQSFGLKQSQYVFGHGAVHMLPSGLCLINSYHSSRYNINTGTLTQAMFDDVIGLAQEKMLIPLSFQQRKC